jgi:kelch-like protein 20
MFASEMVETTLQEIQLHEISAEAMELLIDYCYTAQISIEERNVQQLLPAACLLQVDQGGTPHTQVILDDGDTTLLL